MIVPRSEGWVLATLVPIARIPESKDAALANPHPFSLGKGEGSPQVTAYSSPFWRSNSRRLAQGRKQGGEIGDKVRDPSFEVLVVGGEVVIGHDAFKNKGLPQNVKSREKGFSQDRLVPHQTKKGRPQRKLGGHLLKQGTP